MICADFLASRLPCRPLLVPTWLLQEWSNIVPTPQVKVHPSIPMKSLYCPTAETTAVSWLLHSSVTQNQASLVVGPAGCGKTSAVRGLLSTLCSTSGLHSGSEQPKNCWELSFPQSETRMHHVEVDLSSQTSVGTMQRHVRGWFGRKVAAARRPAGDGSLVALIDDICMPVPQESGAQPALEVLRQMQVGAATCPLLRSFSCRCTKYFNGLCCYAGSRRMVRPKQWLLGGFAGCSSHRCHQTSRCHNLSALHTAHDNDDLHAHASRSIDAENVPAHP